MQGPEHDEFVSPIMLEFPNLPTGHKVQLPSDPFPLYCPAGHGTPVADTAPAVHTCPAVATHAPEQSDVVNPVALPKRPAAHAVHTPRLSLLKRPTGQGTPWGELAPLPQYLPGCAPHAPEHSGVERPENHGEMNEKE